MAIPTTRAEFKALCLRDLGQPVLKVNMDDDQIEDQIDYALSYYMDYHYDGAHHLYYKHMITANDYPDVVKEVFVADGGTGYTNGASLTFTATGPGSGAAGTLSTDANGTITSVTLTAVGDDYAIAPTVTAPGGTGASLEAYLGGWIAVPDNIIGVSGIFDLTNAITNINNMFSIQYQIALNEIWTLSSYSMVPYYQTMMHLNLIQQLLVGQQPIRFERHRNRMHLDMAWQRVQPGQFLVLDAFQVIDPDRFPDVWKDRWLKRYTTAQIKRVWGNNMKKYSGMELPGRVMMNGQKYYDEAIEEIAMLEKEMVDSYSIPVSMYIGAWYLALISSGGWLAQEMLRWGSTALSISGMT